LDAEGFGKFHSEYRERVVQSIAGFVRDRERAQDIAATAFQVGWANRDRFRGDGSLHTWIQAIARNAAREFQARDRKVQFEAIDRSDAREIPAPERVTDELEKREDRLRLQKALDRLPHKQRRALVAHFVDGFSIREIARYERVPSGTVLSRIHTGKQLLRDAWEALGREQSGVPGRETVIPEHKERGTSQARETGVQQPPTTSSPNPPIWDR
jgi:RNA polymerase sigma-70 factor (ECF subfamily)